MATEFVGGSITSPGLGEGGEGCCPAPTPHDPQTPESIIDLLRTTNPWAADADFDHHGYGLVTAARSGFQCSFRRVDTIKRRRLRGARDRQRFTYRSRAASRACWTI